MSVNMASKEYHTFRVLNTYLTFYQGKRCVPVSLDMFKESSCNQVSVGYSSFRKGYSLDRWRMEGAKCALEALINLNIIYLYNPTSANKF